MRKRERENPCGVCGHYHRQEEGEVCGVCGHKVTVSSTTAHPTTISSLPSEILPDFLYLGTYDHSSRLDLLRALRVSHIINTVSACQNLYKSSFTYHCVQEEKVLPFDDAIHFLDQCEKDKVRVLVYCMTGKSRSSAIVMAYLMKSKGWRLERSYQWVKEKGPSVDISPALYQQLQEYEQKIFGSVDSNSLPVSRGLDSPFGLNLQKDDDDDGNLIQAFSNLTTKSASEHATLNVPLHESAFGAGRNDKIFN